MAKLSFLAVVAATFFSTVLAQAHAGCEIRDGIEFCPSVNDNGEVRLVAQAPTRTTHFPRNLAARATDSSADAAVTGCHNHGSDVYCIDGDGHEVSVSLTATPTGEIPAQYTGCHSHGSNKFCIGPDGEEVQVVEEGDTGSESEGGHEHGESESSGGSGGVHCHFHAGVEHCVGEGESESGGSKEKSCGTTDRDYDVPLRIGTLFVVLVTSAIGVYAPMVLIKLPMKAFSPIISTIIKQFGTGVVMSTAFVHLATHADLMFTNDCIGELQYEATTTSIILAGAFLSFLVEYVGHRIVCARRPKTPPSPSEMETEQINGHHHHHGNNVLAQLGHSHGPEDPTSPDTKFSVMVMEAGIIFHSIIIGVTLVVAGDSFYKTLLVVIVFHQFFEGLALGARIATLREKFLPTKAVMAGIFALTTPVGMAIGIGVLDSFNGNDRDTLIAMGTLDALSAGILVWVGVVDMWARDWVIAGGSLVDAGPIQVGVGGISLVAGMVLMSLLGKWA